MPHHVNRRVVRASLALSALILSAGLSGCGKTESSAGMVTDAKQYQQKGENKAALIQFRNAAAKSPEDSEIRLELAKQYNLMGDAVSAEKEARKAISLGADAARAAPELARALLAQGQPQKSLDATAALAGKSDADLQAIRGEAFLRLHDNDEAAKAFGRALAIQPNWPSALVGMAQLAVANKDEAGAARLIDQAASANPKNATVWMFKASLLRSAGKTDEAVAAYGQAIAANPDNVSAYLERANLEIGAKKFDAAKTDVDAARKLAPNALLVLHTQAVLDFSQAKYAPARDTLAKVLSTAPNYMPSVLLAGAVEMNLGNQQQAEQHLKKYLETYPDHAYARKLLAQSMLRGAQPGNAVAALAPLLKDGGGGDDAQLLALAGQSSLQARDFGKATQYFTKASALAPDDAALHTALGLSKLAEGDAQSAISELERATTLDPKSTQSGIALVRTEVALKHYDKALAAAKALVATKPDDATLRNLEGAVHLTKGDRAAARASFEKASALQPTLYASVASLARLDLMDGKPDAAKQRLTAFLEKDKKNARAMVALAEIAQMQKQPAEATTWLERAHADHPEALAPGMQLANQYLRTDQKSKALALVRTMQTAHPANPELLDLLGQIQAANNDAAAALETYSKLVSVVPKSAAAHARLATAHMAVKNPAAAADDVKRALALDPAFLPAKLLQIDIAMANGQTEQALASARQIEAANPKAAIGFTLEGSVLVAQKKPALAVKPLAQALALEDTPANLFKVAEAMKMSGKAKEAEATVAQWQQSHPANPLVTMYVGETLIASKQYKAASDQLEALAKAVPDNPKVLNNLAYAYQQQNDPRALATGERALKLAPNDPAILDTVGWMLTQQGNTARGLPMLQQAVTLAPASTELRFHLAFALNKSGDKKSAKEQLNKLLSNNQTFPQIDEAKALLKIL